MLKFVLLLASPLVQAASNFELALPPGPLPIGFRVVQQYDLSRAFRPDFDPVSGQASQGERSRPVQTLIWYPATRSGKSMRYGDYLQLAGNELDFTRSATEARAAAEAYLRDEYAPESGPEQAQREIQAPVRARRDAIALSDKFPVVIYAPSISAPAAENADLCEYLASHGYIVLASPSVGQATRHMASDLPGAEAQASDIAFLISYAHTLPAADPGRIGVIGYSWGGLANVLAAAKDSRIKALVSLDGSVRYYPDLVANARYVTAERVTAPMLYVAARPLSIEDLAKRGKPAASFLNDMKYADVYKLTMHPMEHFAFSSTYLRFARSARFNQYPREQVNRAYGWSATYAQRFLDAYLKNDAAARAFLNAAPAANGMAAHAATMDVRLAAAPPPTREQFAAALARQDFRNAHATYRAMFGQKGAAGLPENELNAWGYALLGTGATGRAVEIFRLATEVYPASANAFDSLAEALERSGDQPNAILNYQRSLSLDPANANARRRLTALGVEGAKA
jgi:dienelactone hydrolase